MVLSGALQITLPFLRTCIHANRTRIREQPSRFHEHHTPPPSVLRCCSIHSIQEHVRQSIRRADALYRNTLQTRSYRWENSGVKNRCSIWRPRTDSYTCTSCLRYRHAQFPKTGCRTEYTIAEIISPPLDCDAPAFPSIKNVLLVLINTRAKRYDFQLLS